MVITKTVVIFRRFVLLLVDPTRPWLELVYTVSQEFRQQDWNNVTTSNMSHWDFSPIFFSCCP